MLSRSLVVAALLAVVSAGPCKPVTKTLPVTGDPSQVLQQPDAALKVLKIAVGHGLQNYTCTDAAAPTVPAGALAVLYDVTKLYPGTPGSGLPTMDAFNSLASTVLWSQDIPLNLQNPAGADPGTPDTPNAGPESGYGAVVANPFIPPADLVLGAMAPIPFLGHHYFDGQGSPTFDLSAASLVASVGKNGGCHAPTNADKGILGTGAVDWLLLKDNGRGISQGVTSVYRVITAGGVSHTCAELGALSGSVPYTAFYWFFGP